MKLWDIIGWFYVTPEPVRLIFLGLSQFTMLTDLMTILLLRLTLIMFFIKKLWEMFIRNYKNIVPSIHTEYIMLLQVH